MLPARSLPSLLAVLALALVAASPAHGADITRKKAMWGPLIKDNQSLMPVYAELGVGIFETRLSWREAAPTRPADPRDPSDPAYAWRGPIDYAINEAQKYGIEVLVNVSFTPTWASGSDAPFRAPRRTKDFVNFMEAAARHYPEVKYWMIWGEPNRTTGFSPATTTSAPESKQKKQRARFYAKMLDETYVRLKKISRSNIIIGGNSYDAAGVAPGFQPARQWIRNLKLRNGKPPRMDLYGHNPFSSRPPALSQRPRSRNGLDFADTDDLLKEVNRHLRQTKGKGKRKRKGKKLKVFLSEYSLPTDQDNDVFPDFFVSRETQAQWIRDALQITRRTKGIYSLGYFKLFDEPPSDTREEPLWGLITNDGVRKPGFFAWRDG
ncbi:MAG TPA: hypothetical protein VF533_19180 [Solirubrobacteraceae bacterium]|jgi:hypothetical protein